MADEVFLGYEPGILSFFDPEMIGGGKEDHIECMICHKIIVVWMKKTEVPGGFLCEKLECVRRQKI